MSRSSLALPSRLRSPGLVVLTLLLASAGACASSGEETATDGETTAGTTTAGDDELTWWRDVEPIVRKKCMSCHYEGGIAPFSLESYESFAAFGSYLAPVVEAGVMPPWPADNDCNDYLNNRALSDEQLETILTFVAGDMPEGDPADAPEDNEPPPRELVPDVVIDMPESYTSPSTVEDDYRCFLIPWPEEYTDPRFITGVEILPGEPRIVHHVIVYAVSEADVPAYTALDDADPGAGYTCYGGPGPTNGTARWVGGWVPGQVPVFMPEGVGTQIDPGTNLIMQVHYHPIGMELPDRSAIALELAESVERRGEILPLADFKWLASDGSMLIPAGEPAATHQVSITHDNPLLANILINRLGLTVDTELEIINAGLHMHTFGTHGRVELRDPAAQSSECVLDVPRWDFNWQMGFDLAEPARFSPGQELNVQCWWDNSAENQPIVDGVKQEPKDLDWGEGTSDEMCLGILYITNAEG
ncbi:MAG: monooxygenase [Myxococcales bacterium]|nr:monooxygenase [Myxococcales bacterium]